MVSLEGLSYRELTVHNDDNSANIVQIILISLNSFFSLVNFADEPPTWGHPPDPKVQSKSFKRLQRHLQEHEDDGMYIVCHYHLTDNKLCDSSVIVFCYSVYL